MFTKFTKFYTNGCEKLNYKRLRHFWRTMQIHTVLQKLNLVSLFSSWGRGAGG